MGTFIIIVCIGTALWYAYNFIYDMYFAGKGVVSAATVEEKEVDIGDELKDFQQFDVDGNAKGELPENVSQPQSEDESRYAPPTGTVSYDNGMGATQKVTLSEEVRDDISDEGESVHPSVDVEGNPSSEESQVSLEASIYGEDYDYFEEMINGTSYSGGIDPDMYAAALDDLENDRPGSERSFLNGLYMSEQQEAA